MKKFILALACIMAVSTAAYAEAIDRAVADADNKLMTVSGTLGESVNGKVITLMVLKGDAAANATLNAATDKIEYADILYVDETGAYTKEFGFDVSTGYYTAVAVDESGAVDSETIFYVNKAELDDFAYKIGTGEITGEAIISGITTYKDMLAADMTYFADSRNKSMLLAEIESNKTALKTEKSAKLKTVIQTADDKCKFLDDIENAATWYDVDLLVTSNVALHNMTFTDYNKVSDKSKVCVPLIGVRQTSMAAFVKSFGDLVAENQPTTGNTPSYSGGGGGGGGGIGYIVKDDKKDEDLKEEETKPTQPAPDVNKGTFSDVSKAHWASEPIEALCESGVLSGMGDGSFAPEKVVTRGEAAKIIALAFEMESDESELNFADVPKDSWQYPYVATMYALGITTGKSESEYGVNDGLSREDLAVLLYRVLNVYGEKQESQAKNFADSDNIADYAQEAVDYMSGVGIINGTDNNRFAPKDFATRAQVAKLVYEMTKILK